MREGMQIKEQIYKLEHKNMVMHAVMWTGKNLDTLNEYLDKFAKIHFYIAKPEYTSCLVVSDTPIPQDSRWLSISNQTTYAVGAFLIINSFGMPSMDYSGYLEEKITEGWLIYDEPKEVAA